MDGVKEEFSYASNVSIEERLAAAYKYSRLTNRRFPIADSASHSEVLISVNLLLFVSRSARRDSRSIPVSLFFYERV